MRWRDGLEVEVGVIAAGREGLAQAALHQALRDAKLFDEVALVVGSRGRRGKGHISILGPLWSGEQGYDSLLRSVGIAVEYAHERGPGAHGLGVLTRHHAGDLMDMVQVVYRPRRQHAAQ